MDELDDKRFNCSAWDIEELDEDMASVLTVYTSWH
jgi:hypothetical protein